MTTENQGKAEGKLPQALEEAEGIRFWKEMDGPHFAEFVLNELKTVKVQGADYQISDFCSPEFLSGLWDDCMRSVTEWQEMDELHKKTLAYHQAIGTVNGILYALNANPAAKGEPSKISGANTAP